MLMNSLNIKEAIELEEQVWAALVRGDAETDARLLSDDFLGVYSSGFDGKNGHVGQLSNGPTVHTYQISEAKLRTLADDTVLLSYLACFVRNSGSAVEERMYVTSIWRRIEGVWQNIFSQDTDADK